MKNVTVFGFVFLFVTAGVAAGAGCCPVKKDAAVKEAACAVEPEVDKLLGQIEEAGSKLESFEAEMLFTQEQLLVDAIDNQKGKLYYQRRKDKEVWFLIHFSGFQQIDLDDDQPGPWVEADDSYAFDGRWLTRRNARTKMIQRWEIARQGEGQEMFRLGKGPFPLPFAIKKADVLKEFDATLAAANEKDPAGTAHLLLKPKKDSSYTEKYLLLELWVSKENATVEQIRYETTDSEIHTVRWSKIKLNKKISDKTFELKAPGRDWTVEETPLK